LVRVNLPAGLWVGMGSAPISHFMNLVAHASSVDSSGLPSPAQEAVVIPIAAAGIVGGKKSVTPPCWATPL
jgi:hypothetical protein